MNHGCRQQARGVALITALLIVALATVAAAAVAARQHYDIRRSANLINGDQAYLFALGVETWAVQLLAKDRQRSTIDALDEDWAKQLPPLEVEGGQVAGHIDDLQGRYNLNNLVLPAGTVDDTAMQNFQRLLQTLEIPPEIAFAVADWIDSDIDVNINGGAEDDVYTRLTPPYRTGNTRLTSTSELLLVKDVTPAMYQRLEPYVCALPAQTPLNVNTASAPVLTSLSGDLNLSAAKALVEARAEQPYQTLEDFTRALKTIGGLSDTAINRISAGSLSVGSGYFLVTADTLFGRGRIHLQSALHRGNDGKTEVLLHALGTI